MTPPNPEENDPQEPEIPSFKESKKDKDRKGGGMSLLPGEGEGAKSPLLQVRGLSRSTLLERLKALRKKDLAFILSGLGVLTLAPLAEHFLLGPSEEQKVLTQGFDRKGNLFTEAGGNVYEPGAGGVAPGALPGQGSEVITPLNVRDPSTLVMGPGAAQQASPAAPPPSAGGGGGGGWKEALAGAAHGATRAVEAARPAGALAGSIRGLSALAGSSFGGGPSWSLPAPGAAAVGRGGAGGASRINVKAAPGYGGVGGRGLAQTSGADAARAAAEKMANQFNRAGGAANALEAAAATGIPTGGKSLDVGGQYYGGAEKASGGNQVKDSKSLGESLEFLRAKSELEKAIELKWKKIGWSQFERGKLMQEEFIKEFMKTVVSKGLFDPVGDWMKAITDQWTNVTEKGILCYRHNLPRIKKTSGDSETWQCVPTSANMVCDPIFEGATCAAEGAYKGKDSRAFDTLTCDAGCTDLNYKGGVAGHDDKGKGSRGRTIGEVGSGLSAEIVNNGTLVDDLERKIKAVRDGTKAVKALVDCIGNAGCDAGESAAAGTNLSPSQIADNNALKAAFNDLINRTNASANAMERVQERIKAAQSAAYDAKESAKGAVGLDRDDAKYAKTAADEALKGVGQWEKSDKPEDHKALDDAAKGAQETLDARRTQQGEAETPEGSLRYFALQVTREAQDKLRGAEQSVNDAKTALEGRDGAGAKHADVKTGYDALVALNNAQKLSATGLAIAKTLYTSEGEMYETGGRVEGKTRGLIEKRMNPVIGGLNGQAGTVATADDATHKGLALTASQPASVNAGDPPPADNATTLAVKVAQAPNQAARAPLVQPAKDKIGKGEDDGDNTAMKWIAKSSKAVEDADKALGQDPQALPQKPAAQGVKP